jgi:cytochrome c biogenesis protein ResB
MAITCKLCGEEIEEGTPPGPCSECSSTKRDITIAPEPLRITITMGSPVVTVVRLYTHLLDSAERLFNADEHGVAVIVATTACEVVAERAITKAFATKNVPELEGPVTAFLQSYSIHGERSRGLYMALTGDEIVKEKFWEGYTKLVKHRQEVAHQGNRVDNADARKDLDSAKLFVEHVVKHNGLE